MLSEERQKELDRLLDRDLPDEELARIISELESELESDQEAIDWLAERALLHANLRRSVQRRSLEWAAMPASPTRPKNKPVQKRPRPALIASALGLLTLALLAFLLWPRPTPPASYVTMGETKAAYWESGNLPTAEGSRLGPGTLSLAEGLASLQFDSGAVVVMEAPATLVIVDAMNCELTRGTAVSDIPDSALGFRIKTPSADVVDYGTRFAVSVFEETGETHTHVLEGKVQVEYSNSDEVVELTTGQRNTVKANKGVVETQGPEVRTAPIATAAKKDNWTLLETTKDAYTGHVRHHNSETLLLLKNANEKGPVNRQAYLGFDLGDLERTAITEAELRLHFAPTGWGLASYVPDATFSVFAMIGDVPNWNESILHHKFPGEPKLMHLGSFEIPQGVQAGRFQLQGDKLATFLREHPSPTFSLNVIRDTKEIKGGGLVHGFASRRHPTLTAPTLAIQFSEGTTP